MTSSSNSINNFNEFESEDEMEVILLPDSQSCDIALSDSFSDLKSEDESKCELQIVHPKRSPF